MDKEDHEAFVKDYIKRKVKISDEHIVVGIGQHVYNFNIFSGEMLWDIKTEFPVMDILLIPDKKGIILSTELSVIRIDNDGKKIWEHTSYEDVIVDIQISGNKVDIKEFENRATYSIDISTGEPVNVKINKDESK